MDDVISNDDDDFHQSALRSRTVAERRRRQYRNRVPVHRITLTFRRRHRNNDSIAMLLDHRSPLVVQYRQRHCAHTPAGQSTSGTQCRQRRAATSKCRRLLWCLSIDRVQWNRRCFRADYALSSSTNRPQTAQRRRAGAGAAAEERAVMGRSNLNTAVFTVTVLGLHFVVYYLDVFLDKSCQKLVMSCYDEYSYNNSVSRSKQKLRGDWWVGLHM